MYKWKFLILTQNHGMSSLENPTECFHMTSRRPYWCPKTMKRRPCWCPKPVLWELNSFLTQALSFVPINLHRCWPREWTRSTRSPKIELTLRGHCCSPSLHHQTLFLILSCLFRQNKMSKRNFKILSQNLGLTRLEKFTMVSQIRTCSKGSFWLC